MDRRHRRPRRRRRHRPGRARPPSPSAEDGEQHPVGGPPSRRRRPHGRRPLAGLVRARAAGGLRPGHPPRRPLDAEHHYRYGIATSGSHYPGWFLSARIPGHIVQRGAARGVQPQAPALRVRHPRTEDRSLSTPDGTSRPLVLVSHRGPVEYRLDDGGNRYAARGGGGLVTALSGLAVDRPDVVWVAAAIADEDQTMAAEYNGRAFSAERDGGSFQVRFVENDPEAHHKFYAIIANPILWFIQHYLWDQSNAPDIGEH